MKDDIILKHMYGPKPTKFQVIVVHPKKKFNKQVDTKIESLENSIRFSFCQPRDFKHNTLEQALLKIQIKSRHHKFSHIRPNFLY